MQLLEEVWAKAIRAEFNSQGIKNRRSVRMRKRRVSLGAGSKFEEREKKRYHHFDGTAWSRRPLL
jgi:hypothetical protein